VPVLIAQDPAAAPADETSSWYGVRCVFQHGPVDAHATWFEERITVWRAASSAQAVTLATAEAAGYAAGLDDVVALDLVQAYALPEPPGHGAEVFSLIRESGLPVAGYLERFFDTGRERQTVVE